MKLLKNTTMDRQKLLSYLRKRQYKKYVYTISWLRQNGVIDDLYEKILDLPTEKTKRKGEVKNEGDRKINKIELMLKA